MRYPDAKPYPTLCTKVAGSLCENSKSMDEIEPRRVEVWAEVERLRRREGRVSDFPRGRSRSSVVGRIIFSIVFWASVGAIS